MFIIRLTDNNVVSECSSCRRSKILEFFRRRKKITIFLHSFWSVSFSPLQFTLAVQAYALPALFREILSTLDSPYTPTESPSKGSVPLVLIPLSCCPTPNAHTHKYICIYRPRAFNDRYDGSLVAVLPPFSSPYTRKTKKIYIMLKKGCWTARMKIQVQYHEFII